MLDVEKSQLPVARTRKNWDRPSKERHSAVHDTQTKKYKMFIYAHIDTPSLNNIGLARTLIAGNGRYSFVATPREMNFSIRVKGVSFLLYFRFTWQNTNFSVRIDTELRE